MIRILIFTLLLLSCAKDEFKAGEVRNEDTTPIRQESTFTEYSKFHYDRPPVDLLFIWDNSSSSSFISNETKTALNSLVANIENRFDYQVMMVPLLANGNNGSYFFSASGHSPGNGITTIPTAQASNYISSIGSYPSEASQESGSQRTIDLIRTNKNNGVFREGAYTIVVLMSNGDDNSFVPEDIDDQSYNIQYVGEQYARAKAHDLLCLRGFYNTNNSSLHNNYSTFNSNCSNADSLDATMMRFVSITSLFPRSQCNVSKYLRENIVYKNISKHIYQTPYSNGYTFPTTSYTNYEEGQDQFNLCRGDFAHLFDGVNNAITDAIIKHSYRYWRLAESGEPIDKSSIQVVSTTGQSRVTLEKIPHDVIVNRDNMGFNDVDSNGAPVNGYRVLEGTKTVNRRFLPTPGEAFTGQVIELFGSAKVTYPTYITVNFKEPYKYYGYVHLSSRPLESSIKFYKNGQLIPKSTTNGWSLVKEGNSPKYMTNFNILVKSPNDLSPATPGENKTGYFIKLSGSAVYSNGDSTKVDFRPTTN